jgi:hypothetical protein
MSNAAKTYSLENDHSLYPRVPRYNLISEDDGRVRLAEGRADDGPILIGRLANISASGAMVEIRETTARARFLDEGEMIKLELAVPERGRFAFFATVARLDPSNKNDDVWELGLVFRNLPSGLSEALDRYITTRSSDYSHPANFDFAAARGFKHASYRMTPAKWMALAHATILDPLWWMAIVSFSLVAILPVVIARLSQVLR